MTTQPLDTEGEVGLVVARREPVVRKVADATNPRRVLLHDVLTTAVEGGIGYWGRVYSHTRSRDLSWVQIEVLEHESAWEAVGSPAEPRGYEAVDEAYAARDPRIDPFLHVVGERELKAAFRAIMNDRAGKLVGGELRKQLAVAWISEDADLDSTAADVLVQIAALGEIVYG